MQVIDIQKHEYDHNRFVITLAEEDGYGEECGTIILDKSSMKEIADYYDQKIKK